MSRALAYRAYAVLRVHLGYTDTAWEFVQCDCNTVAVCSEWRLLPVRTWGDLPYVLAQTWIRQIQCMSFGRKSKLIHSGPRVG